MDGGNRDGSRHAIQYRDGPNHDQAGSGSGNLSPMPEGSSFSPKSLLAKPPGPQNQRRGNRIRRWSVCDSNQKPNLVQAEIAISQVGLHLVFRMPRELPVSVSGNL